MNGDNIVQKVVVKNRKIESGLGMEFVFYDADAKRVYLKKDKNAKDIVIKETLMPSVLLEIGYMSNAAEEKAMTSDAMQDKIALSIVDGIKQYFQLQ